MFIIKARKTDKEHILGGRNVILGRHGSRKVGEREQDRF